MSGKNSMSQPTGKLKRQAQMDQQWLRELCFRKSESESLTRAAQAGDIEQFSTELQSHLVKKKTLSKRDRRRLQERLTQLWSPSELDDDHSFAALLFDEELESAEFSERVESILAGASNGSAGREESCTDSVVTGIWILHLHAHRLQAKALFALWRWILDQSEHLYQTDSKVTADDGFEAVDLIELQCLVGWQYSELKYERASASDGVKALRQALDASTDGDGTPHACWLEEILPRLVQLARINLFASSIGVDLWDRKSEKRIERFIGRVASLLSPKYFAFSQTPASQVCLQLQAVIDAFEFEQDPTVRRMLKQWSGGESKALRGDQERLIRKEFEREAHQSDWAEWGILRSAWSTPVDLCAVRYDRKMPSIEVVVANTPLFAGDWNHKLTFNGKQISTSGEWSCCCWYLDKDAAYMELQLNNEGPATVIRQALLMRQESALFIGDSVRLNQSGAISYRRTLPLIGDWNVQEDAATRELALINDSQRVRVFPWTSPQYRVDRATESLAVKDGKLELSVQTNGSGLFAATLFEWSQKQQDQPVDWQRVTVAEDGKALPADVASAVRLRLGKSQWLAYHSLKKPPIPRTTMGLHTPNETVIAHVTESGEIKALVEVEL
ncbi:hypothetical protein [Planctomicrobium sp. SH527]|uniref:hypothetical protein n=1 Tax=Planctomicrobium sp. SH527 TaxID=3448123 RepID=UPI003F5B6651